MFPSKVSRFLVLTSVALLFIVSYTTLYLYHSVPPSYPTADSQVVPIQDAAPISEEPQVDYVATVAETTHEILTPDLANPTSSPIPTVPDEGSSQEQSDKELPTQELPVQEPSFQEPPAEESSVQEPPIQQPPAQQPPPPAYLDTGNDANAGASSQEELLPLPDPEVCPDDLKFLVRASIDLELTERVRYTRRYIRPDFSGAVNRDEVANITEPLIQGEVEVDLYDCGDVVIPSSAPIKLHVPNPHPDSTFEHLIFGIATDYDRLNDSISSFSHWISGTGAKIVAVVTDAKGKSSGQMGELQHNFDIAGINATLVKPINESFTTSQNHFSVLINMFDFSSPETKWYGLLDDDTFFPGSLKPLSDSLAALDHSVDAYVGALSEDFSAVRNFGFMAFGGAGAFLSAPLARKLATQALNCINGAIGHEGDTILRDCVYTNSKAKLTILPDLHQQDFRNDMSGWFEAGVRPLNLHHWKSWYKEPVEKMAKAAKFCGDCFLQRWRFGTDTVFSNGFSIATYRDGVESVNLQLMEGTFDKAESRDYDFSVGPLRDAYDADQKKSYKLREAEFAENGDLRQLYVRVGNSSVGELDQVVELIWQNH
ncbi:glycosyltransferase family 31 protein [Hypoxylon rubiginosum]|uniref:Glycosyltransferase family 31 protein n=1 Tax=Hypoxylon rubiginosum TaxID=110542 RepID=A0ACC0DM12_9PEZI|nr:glycosyltransferase family 31 protein [Hypoxylon rubiginosum]